MRILTAPQAPPSTPPDVGCDKRCYRLCLAVTNRDLQLQIVTCSYRHKFDEAGPDTDEAGLGSVHFEGMSGFGWSKWIWLVQVDLAGIFGFRGHRFKAWADLSASVDLWAISGLGCGWAKVRPFWRLPERRINRILVRQGLGLFASGDEFRSLLKIPTKCAPDEVLAGFK
jgi:hypothetical protein